MSKLNKYYIIDTLEGAFMKNECLSIKKSNRATGLELLKFIGIFLIVICHVVSTLGSDKLQLIGYNDYFLNIALPSKNIQHFILGMLSYSGILGNAIFLISSIWFLLDKEKTNGQKIFRMVCEIWFISVVWLLVTICFTDINLTKDYIKQSLMPTYHFNNWFLTYYIVLSLIFPFLNIIIKNINKRQHLIISIVLFICYIVLPFKRSFPFANELILWISVYFIIGYFKTYCIDICNNTKLNRIILISNILIQFLLILGANIISLSNIDKFIPLTNWLNNFNVFIYIIAFSAINIYRNKQLHSNIINYLASFSMLIYIIHENLIFRDFYRPVVWQFIYNKLGYNLVLLWCLLYALLLFIASYIIAFIYKVLLQKILYKLFDLIYGLLKNVLNFIIDKTECILHKHKEQNN